MQFYSKYSSSKNYLPLEKHYLFLDWIGNAIGTADTNSTNQRIARENLAFQRERAEIEDARYEDETAYNRAWAEENRDYERALQQTLFDREDTAIQRQAESLSSMGINPASQQLNGLGAGQALSPSSAPATSTQDSEPLNNTFQKQSPLKAFAEGLGASISQLVSIANTMNGIQTGQYQRDALALENDAKFLQNLRTANSLGIKYDKLLLPKEYPTFLNLRKNDRKMTFFDDNGTDLYDKDYFKDSLGSQFKKDYLDSVPSWVGNLSALSDDNVYSKTEKALTKASDLFDNVSTKLGNESIYELGKMNGKFNPIQLIKSLFF